MLANPYSAMLRFNVGHVLSKSVGFISEIRFSAQQVDVSSDLKLVRLLGDACLTRTPPGILFEGELDVDREMQCVRCLSEYLLHSKVVMSELYTYPPDSESEWTIGEDCMLNVAPLLREMLLVEEPMKSLCGPHCKGLCHFCGQDWNLDRCACVDETVDARFTVLRKFLEAD